MVLIACRILVGSAIAFVVLCAAIAGLTYGMVVLAKDTRVSSSGVLMTKGSEVPVATGGLLHMRNWLTVPRTLMLPGLPRPLYVMSVTVGVSAVAHTGNDGCCSRSLI